MRIRLGWARCADNVADILRRGAWYPIVEESADGHLVVEVREQRVRLDRKSTRLNSSHGYISYAVFCLKKKKILHDRNPNLARIHKKRDLIQDHCAIDHSVS